MSALPVPLQQQRGLQWQRLRMRAATILAVAKLAEDVCCVGRVWTLKGVSDSCCPMQRVAIYLNVGSNLLSESPKLRGPRFTLYEQK